MKSSKVNSMFLLICMVLILASCMTPDPGNTQGENVLKEKISRESKIPMTISNFTKTNGIKREVMGQPIYTMEFNAKIKIEQKCGTLEDSPFLNNFMQFEEFKNYIHNIYYVNSRKTIFYPGALLSYDGEITFEKTEKGWRSTDCNLMNFKLLSNQEPMPTEFTSIGIIQSKEYMGAKNLTIFIQTTNSTKLSISCNCNEDGMKLYKNNVRVPFDELKEGIKIGVNGKWQEWGGEKYIEADRIDIQ